MAGVEGAGRPPVGLLHVQLLSEVYRAGAVRPPFRFAIGENDGVDSPLFLHAMLPISPVSSCKNRDQVLVVEMNISLENWRVSRKQSN
jgi:hypothetical protein